MEDKKYRTDQESFQNENTNVGPLVLHRNIINLFLLHIFERIKQRGNNIGGVGNGVHGVRLTAFRHHRLVITFHSQLLLIN